MARRRDDVADLLLRIDRLSEVEQCELLEQILLRHRPSDLGWDDLDRLRAELPRRSERAVKRDVDAAVREVRRELARETRR